METNSNNNNNNNNKGVHGTTFPISISTANLSVLHWLPYRADAHGLLLSECSFLIFNQDLQTTQKLSHGDQGTYKLVNAIFLFLFMYQ